MGIRFRIEVTGLPKLSAIGGRLKSISAGRSPRPSPARVVGVGTKKRLAKEKRYWLARTHVHRWKVGVALTVIGVLFVAMLIGWVSYGSRESRDESLGNEISSLTASLSTIQVKYQMVLADLDMQKQTVASLRESLSSTQKQHSDLLKQTNDARQKIADDLAKAATDVLKANRDAMDRQNQYLALKKQYEAESSSLGAQWTSAVRALEMVQTERDKLQADYLKLWEQYKALGGL